MVWFERLSASEKTLIKYGAIIVGLAICWVFIYQPINKSIKVKQKQKIQLQNQYTQMQESQDLFAKQASNASKFHRDSNKPFISWVDEQLLKNQLAQFVTRSEPKDNQTLILTFESIVFDELIQWLELLELNYNVKISEADISLLDRSNGLCNARITLEENK
ncbi:hypothetical protein MNBD_GAMMA01-956 [hydrothermal vent metagenome]|uniref:General secretion pathway protein M n=1 Tax=hydrothermal vent metagenome TaxID=652676 RepID=A0A3B0VTE7_9ZZZZ